LTITRKDTDITAGVPGLSLSGLFVLLSALALPLARRRGAPRARAGRLFCLAVVMIAAIILTWEVIVEVVTTTAKAGPTSSVIPGAGSVRVPIIVISAATMVLVIATAAALLRLAGVRPTPPHPDSPAAGGTAGRARASSAGPSPRATKG
jgi:hypothetical protein